MYLYFYSVRHCQLVATMALVRRFGASSATFDFVRCPTKQQVAKWIACTAHTSSHSHLSSPVPTTAAAHWSKCRPQHVFFTELPVADNKRGTAAWRWRLSTGPSTRQLERWHSLHWDQRDSSVMCVTGTSRGSALVQRPSDVHGLGPSEDRSLVKDLDEVDPPVLFAVEQGAVSRGDSTPSSILAVPDSLGIGDVAATLRRLSTALHLQRVLTAAARPWNQEASDDIIIRSSHQPITSRRPSDITSSRPIGHQDYDNMSQPSHSGMAPSTSGDRLSEAHCTHRSVHASNANRKHLFLRTFDDIATTVDLGGRSWLQSVTPVPSVTSVLSMTSVQSLASDREPSAAKVEASLNETSGGASPHSSNDSKPSKEQILLMYERLATEMPNFLRDSHDFSMYANTVEFDNRIVKLKTKGLPAYKLSINSLRTLCSVWLVGSTMEVLRLTAELELGEIHARWRLKGVPLHSVILTPWRRKPRYFDAFSTFQLGEDGLIHRHKLDKVMPTPSDKVRAPSIATRIGIALGLVRNPALSPNCMVPKPLSFLQAAKTSAHKL